MEEDAASGTWVGAGCKLQAQGSTFSASLSPGTRTGLGRAVAVYGHGGWMVGIWHLQLQLQLWQGLQRQEPERHTPGARVLGVY